MALALYLITAVATLAVWSRSVQRVSLTAAIVLLTMPLLPAGRALLTGKTLAPVDISFMAEPFHAYAKDYRVESPHNIYLSDLHCQIIPWQKAVRYSLANGEWPLWNPFILGGDILAAAAQPAVYDPLQWLSFLIPLQDAFTFQVAITFFLAAFFTFAFARSLGLGEVASFTAAGGFMLCGMLAFFAGWPLGRTWAYLPLVLFAVRRPALLTIAFVLVIVSGHPESVLHVVFVGAVWGVFEVLGRRGTRFPRRPKNSADRNFLVILSRRNLVSKRVAWRRRTFQWATFAQSVRGKVLRRPAKRFEGRFLRLRMTTRVRSSEFFKSIAGAFAAGAIALGLTAVYLLPFAEAVPQTLENHIRRELYAPTSYDTIVKPEVRLERMKRTFLVGHRGVDPLSARVGPIVLALAAIGAAIRFRRRETWFFVALALFCLCATFGAWPVAHALHSLPLFDIAINERLAFAAAFALSILAAFAVDALAKRRMALAVAVLAAVLLQRTHEDGRMYPAVPREAFFPRVPLSAQIPRDARMTATGLLFTANNPTMYGLEDVRGYQAMTNKRLYETYPLWATYQHAWFNRVDDLTRPFLSFLNVRYAVAAGDAPAGWRVLAEDRGTRLLENTHELPRAFVPRTIRYVRDGAGTVEAMKSAPDFTEAAWIEAPEYEPHEIANGGGQVTLQRSGLAYELTASMERAGWIVVSATAWKGWRAYVDGRRVTPHFANHAFLGVHVPAGTHRVELRYLPDSFTRGRAVSLATAVLLLLLALISRPWRRSSTSQLPSA